jgi:Flp pilus assembly secretin CpaC
VTPYITRPIASTAELQLASDKFDTPSQTERVLLGKTEKLLNGIPIAGGLVVNSLRIRGNVGFMFD